MPLNCNPVLSSHSLTLTKLCTVKSLTKTVLAILFTTVAVLFLPPVGVVHFNKAEVISYLSFTFVATLLLSCSLPRPKRTRVESIALTPEPPARPFGRTLFLSCTNPSEECQGWLQNLLSRPGLTQEGLEDALNQSPNAGNFNAGVLQYGKEYFVFGNGTHLIARVGENSQCLLTGVDLFTQTPSLIDDRASIYSSAQQSTATLTRSISTLTPSASFVRESAPIRVCSFRRVVGEQLVIAPRDFWKGHIKRRLQEIIVSDLEEQDTLMLLQSLTDCDPESLGVVKL